MSKRSKILWLGLGGGVLLSLGVSTAIYSACRPNERNTFGVGVVLSLVGIGILWGVAGAWKKMNGQNGNNWPDWASALASFAVFDDDEARGLEGSIIGALLVGLCLIGLSIYPFSHLSEYGGDSGIWTGTGFLIFGIIFIVPGVHLVTVRSRRIAAKQQTQELTKTKVTMKTKILVVASAAFILTCLLPPWQEAADNHGHYVSAGYRLIFFPPDGWGIRLDFSRLFLEWAALAAITGIIWLFVAKPSWTRDNKANRSDTFIPPPGNPEN